MLNASDFVQVNHIQADFPISDLENKAWQRASEVEVVTYWSGSAAPVGRHFKVRLLWSDIALYVRFEATQTEPLVVSEKPDLGRKTMNLWDRDVCEIFIAPDRGRPERYFEFEVAPSGEWIDLAIEVLPDKRVTDWEYKSGMKTAASIGKDRVIMAFSVEWKALGKMPRAGDIWLGNLLRCVGKGPGRGYLAWRPTRTTSPSFHVPKAFGEFIFKGRGDQI
jgi:hypothetical protein